ncbi:hypothetical protein ACFU6R_04490 [Streptomyces sp. NPDC057499]|uniref:hypothetical protein n=1 Tax=Streptomyces sp. NPDC057499 TaxID=3346150 RepID=UPI00368E501F
MALMKISGDRLVVEFEGRERMWLRRDGLTVPLAAVRQVVPVGQPLREAHGTRKGLQISGATKIGTWGLVLGPRQLVAAYRGKPGLRVVLDRAASGEEFDELVLSLDDADRLAGLIGAHLEQNR